MLMQVGAYGWEHDQWQGSFYENKLPEDWHLTFYAKRFNTVLAPYEFWTQCSVEQVEEFCSDVDKDYPLLFEVNENETDEKVIQLLASVDSSLKNTICFNESAWSKETSGYHLRQAQIVQSQNLVQGNAAVFLLTSDLLLKDVFLREIMQSLKTDFSQYDVIYLYFGGELVNVDVIRTGCTLLKMLSLNH